MNDLFLEISQIVGVRLTKDNFRAKLKDVNSTRGITGKDKTEIIIAILDYLVKNEK